MNIVIKLLYYIRKDILLWVSYKTQFVLGLFSGFIGIVQFGLIGKFISQGGYFPLIQKYGGNIMAYLITGSVFMSYTNLSLMSFKNTIQREQNMGTLEYVLLSKTPLWQLFLFNFTSSFIFTTMNVALLFLSLIYIFSVPIVPNFLDAFFVLLIIMFPLTGIGLLSASAILITKRGDPVGWLYSTLSGIFSGIYYPVEILPKWLRPVSYFIPSTYGIDVLRKILMNGESFYEIKSKLIPIILLGIIIFPAGLLTFKHSFKKARICGTLTWY